ncbi:hypothetical protein T11_6701, partial [Trichinella zimbabwensis]
KFSRKSPSEHPKCEKRLFRKFSRKSPSVHPISAQFTLKVRKTTFQEIFALWGELSTIWVLTGRFSQKFPEKSFYALWGELSTIWVLTGRFSRKFPEKSFYALFRVN